MPFRRRKPRVPKGYRRWPETLVQVSTARVIEAYQQNYGGCIYEPEEREKLMDVMAEPDGEKVCYDNNLVGSGAGKLSLPFLPSYERWPKMWPCPGQQTGDCVSHGGKNAAIVLIGMECFSNTPDEKTGVIEGFPEISALGESEGVVACEPSYGHRGHRGQGASCDRLIQYFLTVGGIHLRQDYTAQFGLNLETYQVRLGMNWGGSGTPTNVNEEGKKHQIRSAADCANEEIVRDFCANGYPGWACSGLGWSGNRDEFGYSRQQGGWSHSWIIMGYDDRPETIRKYGFPLFLYQHDWGKWNSGGRDVRDSAQQVPENKRLEWIKKGLVNESTGNVMIPEGSFWGDSRLLRKCDVAAMSSTNGWPSRQINYILI